MIGGKRRLYPGDVYAAGRRPVNPLLATVRRNLSGRRASLRQPVDCSTVRRISCLSRSTWFQRAVRVAAFAGCRGRPIR
jgi:hypothetical protein